MREGVLEGMSIAGNGHPSHSLAESFGSLVLRISDLTQNCCTARVGAVQGDGEIQVSPINQGLMPFQPQHRLSANEAQILRLTRNEVAGKPAATPTPTPASPRVIRRRNGPVN